MEGVPKRDYVSKIKLYQKNFDNILYTQNDNWGYHATYESLKRYAIGYGVMHLNQRVIMVDEGKKNLQLEQWILVAYLRMRNDICTINL